MADEYQVEYEYSAGNTIQFKTDDLKIIPMRSNIRIDTRVDGTRVVTDPGHTYRIFTCTAFLTGTNMNTFHDVQMAAITYSGAYPRIKKIYWNGTTYEENIEVALVNISTLDRGAGWWHVSLRFEEKDQ